MTRVACLCEFPTLLGGERSLLATLATLRQRGYEPVALAPGEGPLAAALSAAGVEIANFTSRDATGRRAALPVLRERLAEQLTRLQPSLLHANSLSMGRLSGPVAAAAGLPSIAHLRDIVRVSRVAAADLNQHTRLLAVSQATAAFHRRQGIAAERLRVVYNGVDLVQFAPHAPTGALHTELSLPREARLIGTIGQWILRKGLDVLARAAAEIGPRHPDWHWVLVGARHSQKEETVRYEAQVLETFRQAGLGQRLHVLGTRDDVAALLNEFDLVVHPARQEPLGRVLLEAAAAGRAIVASDVGGTREIFSVAAGAAESDSAELSAAGVCFTESSVAEPGSAESSPPACGTAVLVPPDDAAALAMAIARLMDDAPLRAQTAAAARRRVEAAFDIRWAAARLADEYDGAIAEGTSVTRRG